MNKTLKKGIKKFKRRYTFAISFIAIILIVSHIVLHFFLEKSTIDAKLINIAGMQRMLSQKISKNIYQNKVKSIYRDYKIFKKNNQFLLDNQDKIKDQKINSQLNLVNSILFNNIPNCFNTQNCNKSDFKYFTSRENKFLIEQNKLVKMYELWAGNKLEFLKSLEIIFLIFGLISLFLEILLILRPTEKHLINVLLDFENGVKRNAKIYKLSEIGMLSNNIFHEIKNQLAIVTLSCKYIRNSLEKNKDEKSLKFADKLEKSLKQIQELIISSNKLAREDKKVEIYNLKEACNDIINVTRDLCKTNGIRLEADLDDLIEAKIIPSKFQQVLLNMIKNSIDAIENIDEKWIKIKLYSLKDSAVISIIDSGSGIPLAVREKIFEPYFTTKDNKKGTGLGMHISKDIIEKDLEGTLNLDTNYPNTKFDIILKK